MARPTPWLTLLALAALAGCAGTEDDAEELAADTYTLTVTGIPDEVAVGEPFNFTLTAVGALELTTTHVGAHYWTTAPSDPTAGLGDAMACDHHADPQDVPDTYTVTCTFDQPGTVHVYGHLRLVADGQNYDYWADGEEVTVTA